MQLSDLIVIYLAAAAPIGVAYYLYSTQSDRTFRRLARVAGFALLWPLAPLYKLLYGRATDKAETEPRLDRYQFLDEEEIDAALRACLSALHETEDLAQEAFGDKGEQVRHSLLDACAGLERYVGLTRAARWVDETISPSAREMEMARIAGRGGKDLELAGRCIQRRNAALLRAHQSRARVELPHALADIQEVIDRGYLIAHAGSPSTRRFAEAVFLFYGRVIKLLTLLHDDDTARGVARLLEASAARVRALESIAVHSPQLIQSGDESCTALTPQHKSATQFSPRTT